MKFNKGTIFLLSTLSLLLFCPKSQADLSVDPDPNTWITDFAVKAIENINGVSYVGGLFNYVGPVTGSGVVLDKNTGLIRACLKLSSIFCIFLRSNTKSDLSQHISRRYDDNELRTVA